MNLRTPPASSPRDEVRPTGLTPNSDGPCRAATGQSCARVGSRSRFARSTSRRLSIVAALLGSAASADELRAKLDAPLLFVKRHSYSGIHIYDGLAGVKPGEVKWLRVLEKTSRISGSKMGGSPFNQTFLVSAALAFSVKDYLGLVPVNDDGSVYFEAPTGRALYLQALDADKRLVQSMRTFVQAAPLATQLMSGHDGRISGLTEKERDLLMAWMDSNGLYHGTWDQTDAGAAIKQWPAAREALAGVMRGAGCMECHCNDQGQPVLFENDWFNLQTPELSRILRAPQPPDAPGGGLGLCRKRKVDPARHRVRLLVDGYAHAVKPIEQFPRRVLPPPDTSGAPVVSFAAPNDPNRQRMLEIIRQARVGALENPRVDLPGAKIDGGSCRTLTLAEPALAASPK